MNRVSRGLIVRFASSSPRPPVRTPASRRFPRRLGTSLEWTLMTDRQIVAPGMVPTGPVMLTSRFAVADGYTYDGYVRTGGTSRCARPSSRWRPPTWPPR